MNRLIVILAILGFYTAGALAQSPVRFNLPEYPPFTYSKEGKPAGKGVEIVEKILKRAGIPYVLEVVGTYPRAFLDLAQGSCDGSFLSSKSAERDAIGVFGAPIARTRWTWFTLADSTLDPKSPTFKADAKVGAIPGSNQEKFVKEKGYTIAGSPSDLNSLYRMLKAGRVNVVFLSEDVFLDSLADFGEKESNFRKFIEKELPLSIYMSKKFVEANPGFMDKLNAAIIAEVGKGL